MSLQNILLAMAGKRTKARRAAVLAPILKVVEEAAVPSLSGVSFASGPAAQTARDAGLSWQDFAGVSCSGCAGYTVADVRRIIGGKAHA